MLGRSISSDLYEALMGCVLTEGKFKTWPETAQKQRGQMLGVFHNKGEVVASDAFVMVRLMGFGYPDEFEGKSFDADFNELKGGYPNYNAVFPKDNLTNYGAIETTDLFNVCALIPKPIDGCYIPIAFGSAVFDPVQISRVARVFEALGEKVVNLKVGPHGEYGQLYIETEACQALVMGLGGGTNSFEECYTLKEILETGDLL